MLFIAVFFIELLLLFFASRLLTRSLSSLFVRITKSQTTTIHLLSFLFLPGIIIHELAHMLLASILFVRVGEIEFFPKLTDYGVKLGSVAIAKTDPVRRMLIGVAPVFFGLSLIMGIVYSFSQSSSIVSTIELYALFVISNTMFSSKKDMEGTLELVIAIGFIGLLLYALGIRVDVSSVLGVLTFEMIEFIQKVDVFLSLPIIIDLGVWGTVRFIGSFRSQQC